MQRRNFKDAMNEMCDHTVAKIGEHVETLSRLDKEQKGELLKSIYERSKQVYWLNPEGKFRWNTGDSVMNTYSAYCTKVFECGTIEQLEKVISTLLKTAI